MRCRTGRPYGILPILVAGVSAFSAYGAGAVSDAAITAEVEASFLLHEKLNPFDINTTTVDGTVTLTGAVANEEQKLLAEELAAQVDGVRGVINHIVVADQPVVRPPRRSWKQIAEDRALAAMIRSRLLYHKQFRQFRFDVRCRNGVVTLYGVVPTEEDRAAVGSIVRETRGVKEIANHLNVKPPKGGSSLERVSRGVSDAWLEKRVEAALLMNRYVSLKGLNVTVKDGVCVLAGVAGSPAERESAVAVASSIYGVRGVENLIEVRSAESTPEGAGADRIEPIVPGDE